MNAKVYYLPAAEPIDAPPPLSSWARLQRRLIHGWWRTRLSLADIRVSLWRSRCRSGDDYAALLRTVVEDGSAELIERQRPRRSRPATILDFEAGRLRLRPGTN
ncbi:MAG: hypothetical protein ACRDH5_14840 [bacterium]